MSRVAAGVALMSPVGAEIYWAIKEWRLGGLANPYTLAVIGYGILCLFMAWALTALEDNRLPSELRAPGIGLRDICRCRKTD